MLSMSRMTEANRSPVGNWLLDGLAPDTLGQLRPHIRLVKLRSGQLLWEQGSWQEHVYFPISGAVSILMSVDQDATTIGVSVIGNEGLVGASILLSEGSQEPAVASAEVLIDGLAMQMSASVLREQARQSNELSKLLHQYLRACFVQSLYDAACNGRHSVDERLTRWLLAVADRSPDNAIDVSHAQIAKVLGVRRAGVTLALAGFKASGLTGSVRGHIAILDRTGLEAASCGCYFAIKQEYEIFRHVS